MQEVGCTGKELYYMRKPLPTAGDVSGVLRHCPAQMDHTGGEKPYKGLVSAKTNRADARRRFLP